MLLQFTKLTRLSQVVADLWEPYINLLTEKVPDGEALDKIGCRRYCCRRMIMTHVDLIEKLLKYDPAERHNKNVQ